MADFGVSPISDTLYFNDPRLLQRARLASMLSQSAVTPQVGARHWMQPLAQAFTGLAAGLANRQISDEYAKRRQAEIGTMQQAVNAATPWTVPGGGVEMANGTTLPAGAIAPGTGGPEAMYSTLMANPDTAAMGLQGAMTMATQRAILRAQLANQLAEKGRYIDEGGAIRPIPGALQTTQGEKAAESSGTAAGSYPYDVGKTLVGKGLVTGPNGRIVPMEGYAPSVAGIAGAEEGAKAAAQFPYQAALERSKPMSMYGQSGVYVPPVANPADLGATGVPPLPRAAQGGAVPATPLQEPAPQGAPPAPGTTPTAPVAPQTPGRGAGGVETFHVPGGATVVRTSPGPLGAQTGIAELAKLDANRVNDARKEWATNARDIGTIQMIQDFLPKVATGWSAESRLEAGRVLQALGADPKGIQSFLGIDPTAGQLLNKKFLELSTAAVRTMGAREPGSVLQMFRKAYPNLETTPQAIILQTNALLMDRQRQLDYATSMEGRYRDSVNAAQAGGEYKGLTNFEHDFAKTNNPAMYLKAAEAMSGAAEVNWKSMPPEMQSQVIGLIPSGHTFVAPDGTTRVKP